MVFTFDVSVATHDDLKAGILAHHVVFVTVWSEDFTDAECTAAQMAMAMTGMMPTATNVRI